MKKVLGFILLIPMLLLISGVFITPLIIGITNGDWIPSIVMYGTTIVILLAAYGFDILDNLNSKG